MGQCAQGSLRRAYRLWGSGTADDTASIARVDLATGEVTPLVEGLGQLRWSSFDTECELHPPLRRRLSER